MRGYRPFRARCRIGCLRSCVVVLCSLNVFGGCKMDCCVRSCYCICLIVLFVGLIGVVGQWAPTGRYSCKAQGASPGLYVIVNLLSPFRGGTSCASIGCCGGVVKNKGAVSDFDTAPLLFDDSKSEAWLYAPYIGSSRRPLHNTALATLLSTFRLGHLQE